MAALTLGLMKTSAQVDPNFYIYLCFGQSNMEGNAPAEAVDKAGIDKRFRLLATCDFSSPSRKAGNWYDAVPPLVNPVGNLGPSDYFGRTMVAALPDSVRVGVVPVAMGGSPIEMFDKDKYAKKMAENPNEWWAQIARNNYGSNPYKRLVDMGKIAQKSGVIKGILLHQGCSNNGDPNWPSMVKKIYEDLLADLGLGSDSVPLFVGETLRQENGGACYGHNTQVARMPSVVSNSHVISSEGLPGNGQDPWHFNANGYRILGKRYAVKALQLMGMEPKVQAGYSFSSQTERFYAAKSFEIEKEVLMMPSQSAAIPAKATFNDGHTEDVSKDVDYVSDVFKFSNGIPTPVNGTEGDAEAVFTDFTGAQFKDSVHVALDYFPMTATGVAKLSGTFTYDESARSMKFGSGGVGGWLYKSGIDLSAFKYLVIKLKEPQTIDAQVRISSSTSVSVLGYRDTINERTTVVIDLHNMHYNNNKSTINPERIFMIAFRGGKSGMLYLDDVFLTNDEDYATAGIASVSEEKLKGQGVYTLQGMKAGCWEQLRPGIYIVDGRIVRKK